jgi:anti-sigma factor RsiW
VTCRELADFIADYLTGDLSPDVRTAFDHHLVLCPNCRRYLASYQATVTLGKRIFDADDAPVRNDVPEELVRAILEARRDTNRS